MVVVVCAGLKLKGGLGVIGKGRIESFTAVFLGFSKKLREIEDDGEEV